MSKKRNTVADNCLEPLPRHYVGYCLKDGSFAVVKGGTAYRRNQCELLAAALQSNYTHTLVVIDGEAFDKIRKKYYA